MLGAALVLSVMLAPPVSAQSASPSDVSVTLSPAKQAFGRSSDVTVRVTIANAGAVDARVLSWLTPANGVQAPIFDVSRDGDPTAYLACSPSEPRRRSATTSPYPRATSLEYDVDLSDVYSFTKTGDYEVSYSVTAAQLLGTGAKSTPNSWFPSPVTVAVAGRPDAAPRVTPESGAGLTYSACSPQQQSDLSTAFTEATSYAGAGVQYFTEERRVLRYQLWFGAFDNTRWATVESHYSLIRACHRSPPLWHSNAPPRPRAYAYVYPNDPYKIYLGDAFWPAPMTGTDSKAGTLIHELSHFTVLGGTQDYVYGQTGAKNLAISNPAQAVMNADSHEYFVENTPVTADGSAYTLSTTSLDFGEQTAGSTSAPRSVTLISRGDANLVIGSLNASGEFGLASDTCTGDGAAGRHVHLHCGFPADCARRPGQLDHHSQRRGTDDQLRLAEGHWNRRASSPAATAAHRASG